MTAWNTTGCEPGFAHDTIFPSNTAATGCTLNITVFNVIISVLTVLQFVVLVWRIAYIIQHARETKRALVFQQYVTIGFSIISFLAVMLMTIIPNTATRPRASGSAIVLLFGIELCIHQLGMIRWVAKIRRLGFKLILKRLPKLATRTTAEMDKRDLITLLCIALAYAISLAWFILLCIVNVIVMNDPNIVRAAFGLFGAFLVILPTAGVHQTQQCCQVIIRGAKAVETNLVDGAAMRARYQKVIDKFRLQQYIMIAFAVAGCLLCFLVAGGVIPLKYDLLLALISLDVAASCAMMGSVAVTTCCCCAGWGKTSSQDGKAAGGGGDADAAEAGALTPSSLNPRQLPQTTTTRPTNESNNQQSTSNV